MGDDALIGMMDKAKVIAFDVFDTLIVRPFMKPTHLFDYMEREYSVPGFAKARISAERKARGKINVEANFDEIYSMMDRPFSELKEKELETELALCSPDRNIGQCWDYAIGTGKPVVLVSDMYLPSEFIGKMLEKCGYSGWKKIFVSNERRVNKCGKELYASVVGESGIGYGELLMIGDNTHSDYGVPENLGIPAFRWKPMRERYAEKYPLEYKRSRKDPELSMIAGTDMIFDTDDDGYWHSIGRRFAGPLAAGFGTFVLRNDSPYDRLFFCSRDGYMVMKAYGILGGKKDYRYVYSSRFLSKVLSDPGTAVRKYPGMVDEYLACTGNGGNGGTEEVLARDSRSYSEYLGHCAGDAEKILLVDSTAMNFTAQKDLQTRLPGKKITGCYYSVVDRDESDYFAYADRYSQILTWNYVNFSEYFLSSDEVPPRGFRDGKPLFAEPSGFEKERISRCGALQGGMVSYLENFKRFYGDSLPSFSPDAVDRWMDVLVSREKRDRTDLWNIRWPYDATNSLYVDLIFRPRDLIIQGIFIFGLIRRKISH